MVEKYTAASAESDKQSTEQLENAGEAQRERLQEQREATIAEKTHESNVEADARNEANEALELATMEKEKATRQEQEKAQHSAEKAKPVRQQPSKGDLQASFNTTMKQVRKEMSPAERTFSKVIHNPVVEKVSGAVGSTVARPNLIIAGGLGTLIFGAVIYLTAKHYGYVLSGFEAMGTFILGWCIGAIIEFARVGFLNTKRR